MPCKPPGILSRPGFVLKDTWSEPSLTHRQNLGLALDLACSVSMSTLGALFRFFFFSFNRSKD